MLTMYSKNVKHVIEKMGKSIPSAGGSNASDPPPPLYDACPLCFLFCIFSYNIMCAANCFPQQDPCCKKMKTEKIANIFCNIISVAIFSTTTAMLQK